VLPGELGGLCRPGQRGPDTGDLVRRDLLAVAGSADDDAQAARVAGDGAARREDRSQPMTDQALGVICSETR